MQIRTITATGIAAGVLLAVATSGHAHITFQTSEVPANSFQRVVLQVPHGCAGSPTTGMRLQIPEGLSAVKPQPKPGWEISIVPRDGNGGVAEVRWKGGRLLDEHYDEFVLRVRIGDLHGQRLYVPTIQECEAGMHRWIDIPREGEAGHDLAEPAPFLNVTAAKAHDHHGHDHGHTHD